MATLVNINRQLAIIHILQHKHNMHPIHPSIITYVDTLSGAIIVTCAL